MLAPTSETGQTAATPASAAGADAVDAELFANELGAKLTGSGAATTEERIAQAIEKLAAAIPGISVTNRSMSSFSEIGGYYVNTGLSANVNITESMMARMADDGELFDSVKNMIESLFAAGENQNLVAAGGDSKTTNINVTETEIRYVEVQRSAGKSTLSVSSLALEAQKIQAETLLSLLDMITNRNGSQRSSAWDASFDMLNSRNAWEQGGDRSFGNLVGGSSSWRFEAYFSSVDVAGQALRTRQELSASLEVVVGQIAASGASASGMDLYTYMQLMQLTDPLVLDLGGTGINLTSEEEGVYFDIHGDGRPVRTAFIQGDNAFLYLDRDGNGVADSVNELFGDQGGYANGFENLRQYDENGDGVIDEKDSIYGELRLWRDVNGDGVNQAGESLTLAQAGVRAINLGYASDYALDKHGNVIGESSTFTRSDGTLGLAADVWLKSRK